MQIGNDDINDDDDDDINDEDLDAFLVLLESRLRADFTSPDLSRIISSQGTPSNSSSTSASSSSLLSTLPSGNASSPSKFLRLIHLVFSKAGKSIKLRSLMSVLGLDDDATVELSSRNAANSTSLYAVAAASSNNHTFKEEDELTKGRKTDAIVYKLLNQAENDDEKWVRVVAGIIKRLMFINNRNNSSNNINETTTTATNTKETESEKQLRKITTNILSTIEKTYTNANNKFNETKTQLTNKIHIESTDDIEVQQKLSKLDDSNIKSTYLIGLDSYPTYTPLYYTLVSSSLIKDIIPQLNDTNNNPHFTSNMNADILKVDGEVEKKRAEEEGKEITNVINMKKSSRLLPSSNNNGSGIAGTSSSNVGGRGRGNSINNISTNGNAAGRGGPILTGRITSTRRGVGRGGGGSSSGGASLFRPSSTLGRGGGRGGGGRFGGGGGGGGRGNGGGRSGSLSRLVAAGGRGTGGRVGSISAPLQRRVPGAARSAILNSSSSGRGSVSSVGRGGRGGGGGSSSSGGGTGETKMKMIDASEVEDLTRAAAEREKTANMSTVQARKLERKRKLMESAAASGLRNREKKKKKIAAPGGGDTTAAGTNPSGGSNEAVSAATAAVSQNESNITGNVDQQQQPQQQQHSAASITSLLEKSNKLSPEDRQTIFQFFQNRNNNQGSMSQPAPPQGTDESGIWRVKLNEDKAFDESTGEVVKETLYLELDYKSLGYKKTRKIKRK